MSSVPLLIDNQSCGVCRHVHGYDTMPSSSTSAKDTEHDHNNEDTNASEPSDNTNDDGEAQEQQDDSIPISPLKYALKNFASQFFLIPQGTGILAVVLHQLNYQFYGLVRISQVLWVLTIVSLVGFLAIYALRTVLFPRQVSLISMCM